MTTTLTEEIIPEVQGIYLFYLPKKDIYYLGETNNIRQRLKQHLTYNGNKVISEYAKENNDLEFKILQFTNNLPTKERRLVESKYIKDFLKEGYKLLNKNTKADVVNNLYCNDTRPILQFTLKGIFVNQYSSLTEASREFNCSYKNISTAATGVQLSAKKHLWIYKDEFSKELLQEKVSTYKLRILAKKEAVSKNGKALSKNINQFSKSGEFVKTWDSASEASRGLGIHHTNISQCALEKLKSAGGYVWKFVEESE